MTRGTAGDPEIRAMFIRVHRLLARLSGKRLLLLSLALLLVVAALDHLSGVQISFALFYLLPVSIAAWYVARSAGFVFAVVSSIAWYGVEIAGGYPYDHPAIPVWNATMRLGFFLIVAALLAALRAQLQVDRRLARTDPLTEVLNSRAFRAQLEHDLAVTHRLGRPLTLAYVDLDDFKHVNDLHGHGVGDQVLRAIGLALQGATRRSDTVARLGGDEFAVILPGTDLDGARSILSKLRYGLQTLDVPASSIVSCSIGAVVFRDSPAEVDAAIAAADALMYEAKRRGKDAVAFGLYSNATGAVTRVDSAALAASR